jgi:uncharacterized membrane protein
VAAWTMPNMHNPTVLSVLTFPASADAAAALRVLEGDQWRRRVVIGDCAVVAWADGAPRPVAYQVGAADGGATLSGAFWGLLFGSLFLAPLAGLTGPAWPPDGLARIGLPESVLAQVRERTRPGTSALFVIGGETGLDHVRMLGPHCLTTVLGDEEAAALQRAFGAD